MKFSKFLMNSSMKHIVLFFVCVANVVLSQEYTREAFVNSDNKNPTNIQQSWYPNQLSNKYYASPLMNTYYNQYLDDMITAHLDAYFNPNKYTVATRITRNDKLTPKLKERRNSKHKQTPLSNHDTEAPKRKTTRRSPAIRKNKKKTTRAVENSKVEVKDIKNVPVVGTQEEELKYQQLMYKLMQQEPYYFYDPMQRLLANYIASLSAMNKPVEITPNVQINSPNESQKIKKSHLSEKNYFSKEEEKEEISEESEDLETGDHNSEERSVEHQTEEYNSNTDSSLSDADLSHIEETTEKE